MKKIVSYVLACMMMLTVMAVPSYDAYAANVSLSVSNSSVNIGDTITVTVSVPSGVTATVDVYFPTNLFSFVSASGTANTNGGTVVTTLGEPFSSSATIKLKAKTTGTASISASAVKAGDSNTGEAITLGGASKSVTIANKAATEPNTGNNEQPETPKSADNSLSSLTISAGSLSPAFKYNVTKYTATVDYDVTKLIVSAKPSNEKATIESVTGNGNVSLAVGQNTIQVVVKAENGVQATYTIVVTRKEKEVAEETPPSETTPSETPDDSQNSETPKEPQETEQPQETQVEEQPKTFEYNGQKLNIIEEIPAEVIPTDFVPENIVIEGKETPGLSFSKGELKVLYLANEAGYGSFYVYDKTEENIYPLIKLVSEKKYIIILSPDEKSVPKGFEPCTLSIEGKGTVSAYRYKQEEQESTESAQTDGILGIETYFAAEPKIADFYLIYCINSDGEYGWYQFDLAEGTFQRYLGTMASDNNANLEDVDKTELTALKNKQKVIMGIFGAIIVVLFISIISLITSKRKLVQQYEKSGIYEENHLEEDIVDDDISEDLLKEKEEPEVILQEEQIVTSAQEDFETSEDDVADEDDILDISDESLQDAFEISKEVMTDEVESEDEVEVEFFDMSEEIMEDVAVNLKDEIASLQVSETDIQEIDAMETEDETEVEFFDMSEDVIKEAMTDEIESEDEIEVEFFDMSEKIIEESLEEDVKIQVESLEVSEEQAFKRNLEKELAATDTNQENQSDYLDDDDDLEFIDL